MKFPITRESLQAFDYAKEQEELREEEVQKRLAQILDALCNEFKQSMPSSTKEKKFVWRRVNLLTQMGPSRAQNTPVKEYQTYLCISKESPMHQQAMHPHSQINPPLNGYLLQFIDKLKEIFVGCDIIVDPLKTYLIIDWS